MKQLLTTAEATQALKMNHRTFNQFLDKGIITPIKESSGRGATKILSVQQVWSVGIAKSIRAGGRSLEFACDVAGFVERLPADEIHANFADGRSYLLLIEIDGEMSLVPRLTDGINPEPELAKARKQAQKSGIAVNWWYIDTKPMLDQIIECVKKQTTQN